MEDNWKGVSDVTAFQAESLLWEHGEGGTSLEVKRRNGHKRRPLRRFDLHATFSALQALDFEGRRPMTLLLLEQP